MRRICTTIWILFYGDLDLLTRCQTLVPSSIVTMGFMPSDVPDVISTIPATQQLHHQVSSNRKNVEEAVTHWDTFLYIHLYEPKCLLFFHMQLYLFLKQFTMYVPDVVVLGLFECERHGGPVRDMVVLEGVDSLPPADHLRRHVLVLKR